MQIAKNYINDATINMESSLRHLPLVRAKIRALPSDQQSIERYVEHLLTQEEQCVCDMATD